MGNIKSINISKTKGRRKTPVEKVSLIAGLGIKDDAHAAPGDRQISLLSWEDICASSSDFVPGDFAENITTEGLDLFLLNIGDTIQCGETELKISKIGKECHTKCEIYHRIGDCIMPKQGIFAEVIKGGEIRTGDRLEVLR